MAQVTYAQYRDEYGGTATEQEFLQKRVHAAALLTQYSGGRVDAPQPEDIAHCILLATCAVCDALLKNEAGGGIASESNDGVSVSYIAGVSKAKTDDGRLYDAALRFLGNTGLLYRGEG